jgi:archaellum biogenesis ATPase FlaH
MDRKFLKLLLGMEFHAQVKGFVTREMFVEEGANVFAVIEAAHDKYARDLTLEEVRALYFDTYTLTKAQRQVVNSVFDAIELEEAPGKDVAADLIKRFYWKTLAKDIGEKAIRGINNGEYDFEGIKAIADKAGEVEIDTSAKEVDTSIASLMAQSSVQNNFKFKLPNLQERIGGIGPGHNVIIFGRPEVAKSSLTAYLSVGFLEQGKKVLYIGNEEPGWKIALNHVRSALDMSDASLKADMEKGITSYKAWDALEENFTLLDGVGMMIDDVSRLAVKNKPDIIILDQTDKIGISSAPQQRHEFLKELYVQAREIAKRNNAAVINVCQASAEAEGRRYVSFDMMDQSKTGKAGEADLIIGIGKDPSERAEDTGIRYLTVSKNKITGWHGTISTLFDQYKNQWEGIE